MKKEILQLSMLTLIALATLCAKTNAQVSTSAAQQNWKLTGNSGTDTLTNFLGTTDNKALIFRTKNLERMRILNGGKVGIGTKTPAAKLSIVSSDNVSLTTPGELMLGNVSASNMVFDNSKIQARYNGTATTLNLNYYGGSVYSGNYNTSSYGLVAAGIYDGVYGYSYSASGIGAYGYSSTYFGVYGYTGGGTTGSDPNYPAGVHGYNSGYGNGVTGYCVSGTGTVGWSDDYVGVWGHTGSTGSWAGYFDGSVYSTGTYQGSDVKLKQNIKDLSSAMDIINQLRPKTYQFRQDGNYKSMNFPQGLQYGLIAQDVEKILPNLVRETKQDVTKSVETKIPDPSDPAKQVIARNIVKTGETIDFKALNYTELIPIIIKGMQEQQSVIDKQQSIIDKQQQQIDGLKQLVQNVANSSNSSDAKAADISTDAYLLQNTPNPSSSNTTVKYYVPASAKQAQLAMYNINGQLIKTYKLSNGLNKVNITTGSLASGQYTYSLLVDGKKVDSKSMVITN